ncbi:outer membrane beta-barrel family protein [Prevotella sp. AGR2160]|uniref:outer membrane beta-barrel family protein n=1 Tax=Prevotella sp. AGR2160 TaxID=1280674 RepID=UPI00048C0EC2|nr:outer membrane beta-barrel family protein [Prevotella sp. AGR2160]
MKWRGWSPQIQVNYMIDENHSFGAYYKWDNHPWQNFSGWLNTESYEDDRYRELSESNIYQQTTFKKHIFNAYYNGKVGKLGIDFNVDGLFDSTSDPNGTEEHITDAEGNKTFRKVDNFTKSKNRFWATKLVLTYPIAKGTLTLGGEYSYNNRTDSYSYQSEQQLPVTNSDTRIRESMTAGFMEYGRNFGRLFAQAGVRYEYLYTGYFESGKRQDEMSRKYGDWFPTALLSMPLGKVQLSLSYRQDIMRPEYGNLTNSTIYINRYTYQTGNPYLRPAYSHVVVLNAAYKALNFVVNYSYTKDVATLVTEPYPGSDDPLLSIIHPVNTKDGYDKLVINPSFRPTIGKWHPLWSAGWILQNYKTLTASGKEMTMNRPFWQFVWNNDIELPADIRLNACLQLTTKGDYDNLRMTRTACNLGLGVQRDFALKALGKLTADLRCYDIFNTNKSGVTIYGIRELTSYNPSRRYFSLDITWKFNEARSKYRGTGAGQEQKARM